MSGSSLAYRSVRPGPALWIALLLILFGGCSRPGAVASGSDQVLPGTGQSNTQIPKAGKSETGISNPDKVIELVAGTYTDGSSRGVYRFSYDPAQQAFGPATLLATMDNPSYGALSADRHWLYVVEELAEGRVRALHRQDDSLTFSARDDLSSEGAHPCYLSLSPDGRNLAVANYSSGNVAIFRLSPDGAILPNPAVHQHRGHGPNTERQQGPHAHWIQWDPESRYIYAVDLGADQVIGYPVAGDGNQPGGDILGNAFTALQTDPGAGPRHMVFHPGGQWVYLVNELSNQVVVAERKPDGTLASKQMISTLPGDFREHSQAGHIAINSTGTRLYVSNRGHDSIAVFAIGQDGSLRLLQHANSRGHWPRFFLLLEQERLLLVANERSGNIAALNMDEGGLLEPTGQPMAISSPTYIGRLY